MLIISPNITKQKKELKYFEKKYQMLIFKRDEYIKKIEEFNNEYNLRFSHLLNKILNLKEENIHKKIELYKLKKEKLLKNDDILKNLQLKQYKITAKIDKYNLELKLNPQKEELKIKIEELKIILDEVNSQIEFINNEKNRFQKESNIDELEEELLELKEEKNEYQKEIKELEKVDKLSDEEKQELKKIYRKFSKLVHPDIVESKYKDEANNLMAKVNMLYKLNKLSEIKKLYLEVQNKKFIFISDYVEYENLETEIYKIKDKIAKIQEEIDEIKTNEICDMIKNKDNYFKEIQENLNQRLNDLKIERSYLDINIMKYQDF